MIEFGTNPCRYEWCGPRSDGTSPGEVFVCPRCDKHWVWEESTEVIGPSAQWVRFDPALKRTPAPPATYRPERWVRVPADKLAQAEQALRTFVKDNAGFGRRPRADATEVVMREYDRREEWMREASKTILALGTQCAELREALGRVDPNAEARLHAKHKAEAG